MIERTLLRFALVGIGNTILGLGVIYGFRQVTTDIIANFLGYVFVVPVSFLTHRNMSFRDAGQRWPAFVRYLATIGMGYILNLAVLVAGLSRGLNPYIVQAAAIAVYVVVTYLTSRHFVFQEQKHAATHS